MKLLLDEHYANEIAVALRAADHDAVTVSQRGLKGIADEPLLELAFADERALLTNNARDFLPLVARWTASGRDHGGLVLTSDASLPRGKGTIGLYVERLNDLMRAHGGPLTNRVRWLW